MKVIEGIGFACCLIAAEGMCGVIEHDTGLVQVILLAVVGGVMLWTGSRYTY